MNKFAVTVLLLGLMVGLPVKAIILDEEPPKQTLKSKPKAREIVDSVKVETASNDVESRIKKALIKVIPDFVVDAISSSVIKGLYEVASGSNRFYASADGKYIINGNISIYKSADTDSIRPSEITGINEITSGGSIFYVSEDAKYMIKGNLIDLTARKDITENKLARLRVAKIEAIDRMQMINFDSNLKSRDIYVFVDVDCGYCRKLHSEISQYIELGMSIHYLFYPRAGKNSGSYNKAVSVWCAEDQKSSMNNAMNGIDQGMRSCANPIDNHMALAESLGIKGTPMIITGKGNVLPGYVPADKLSKVLETE